MKWAWFRGGPLEAHKMDALTTTRITSELIEPGMKLDVIVMCLPSAS